MKSKNNYDGLPDLYMMSDEVVEEISESAIGLDDAAKERIIKLCEKKLNLNPDNNNDSCCENINEKIAEVKQYKMNKWFRMVIAAAACLILITGGILIGNNIKTLHHNDGDIQVTLYSTETSNTEESSNIKTTKKVQTTDVERKKVNSDNGDTPVTSLPDTTKISGTETDSNATTQKTEKTDAERSGSNILKSIDFSKFMNLNENERALNYCAPVLLENNIVCAMFNIVNSNDYDRQTVEICLADITTGELKLNITLGDTLIDCISVNLPENTNGICSICIDNYKESSENKKSCVVIKEDYSYEIIDNVSRDDIVVPAGNHNIRQVGRDIVDNNTQRVIVQGVNNGDYSKTSQYKRYNFSIGSDKFIYTTGMWESTPNIGIYDFSTGICSEIPDSKEFNVIGSHNNKIFLVDSVLSGFREDGIYVTDINTLQTTLLFDLSKYDSKYTAYNSQMPLNGEYIILESNMDNSFLIIDPDDGSIISENSLGGDGHIVILDNYTICDSGSNNELFFMDLKDIVK